MENKNKRTPAPDELLEAIRAEAANLVANPNVPEIIKDLLSKRILEPAAQHPNKPSNKLD